MTTHLEIYRPFMGDWLEFKTVNPGYLTTFANDLSDDEHELYKVDCDESNLFTRIQKSTDANDILLSRLERSVPNKTTFEDVAYLRNGEIYEVQIHRESKPDLKIRITHTTE